MLSANQVEEIKCQAFLNKPSHLKGVCKVYPYTMGDIVEMGIIEYNSRLGVLLLTETDIYNLIKEKTGKEPEIDKIHPLQYLLASAAVDDMFLLELKKVFSTFVKEDVYILPEYGSVVIGSPEKKRLINERNYRDFQDILRIQNRREFVEPPPENETAGERKMRLLREKVAAVKKKQAQKKGEGKALSELLEIAETYGIDVQNHTLYAFYSLLRRHQLREKWEQDLQIICAGADSKKIKTKYWGESLDDE